ncbi:amidase [Hydrogenophaga sp.]|uniref:amidase n=1 Tax=Hydrogenophaga sp. TaxID=1904254 RepID=UPI002719877A|nr:amidase [Hydrogenophaga sp.]MDO9434198.1 amidase [Hydrogenophaga sp.]
MLAAEELDRRWSLAAIARQMRAGALSAVELTEHCLARVAQWEPQVHAFVSLMADSARQDARRAQAEISAGHWRSALHGIPVGLKDVIDVAGVPTTAQSRQLLGHVPRHDAAVSASLRRAGAVLMGKLTTHEFAFGTPDPHGPFPPARNPWDTDRFASGSSSGAAVATACGMVLGAVGTDTAGSVRSPAALCGVAGFKPGRQRLDRAGTLPLSPSLDTLGVLGWTVEDCALQYAVLAPEATAGWALDAAGCPVLDTDMRSLRVGVIRHFFEEDAPVSDDARTAIDDAVDVLRMLGCRVANVRVPPLQDWNAAGMVTLLAEAYAEHEPWLRGSENLYGESLRDALLLGATISAADYLHARHRMGALSAQLDAVFERFDVLVTAIQPGEAPLMSAVSKWGFIERPSFGLPFNVSDLPALAVHCGTGRHGLPLSLQMVSGRHAEATLLSVAHTFECALGGRQALP